MIRSLRSFFFLVTCSPSITPMGRQVRAHPGKAGSSINTNTSIGSPSSAFVEGSNPKSQYLLQFENVFIGIKRKLVPAPLGSLDHDTKHLDILLEQASSSFVDDVVQLLCQGLRGLVKLNEATCLKVYIRSFQVVTDRLAKLVGYPNSFPCQQ